ncbi:MAG: efflux RND transporter periplasmic adaptor subunit [Acidobacteria bacterium]|nr:efflux RND transporter periplasmic adaptor subunit [Acidobacteriota bacterium]
MRVRAIWWVSLLAAAGALAAWRLLPENGAATAVDADSFIAVGRHDIVSSVAATGKVNPMVGAEVRVGSRISGRVERLHANIGDVVSREQVIAELEKNDLLALRGQRLAEVEIARTRLSSAESLRPGEILKAEAGVADAEAVARLGEDFLARQASLFRDGLVAEQELDTARKERDVAQARLTAAQRELDLSRQRYAEDVKSARAQIRQAEAALQVIAAQLSYATIRAPIAGVIGSISTQEGETVAAGLNSPTFVTIIDLGRLQVDAFVDEVDIGKIAVGQSAAFTVDAFPDRDFPATVRAIYPKAIIMDNVVYYDVVLVIDEPLTGQLRPEMTANVIITLEARRGVLAVPLSAVTREEGRSVVYVLRQDRPEPQAVRIGRRDGERVEILSGLNENDRVLVRRPARSGNGGE